MEALKEHFFYCPYCGEHISMLLELLYQKQTYIEDCQVCCQPIEIHFTISDNFQINTFKAVPAQ